MNKRVELLNCPIDIINSDNALSLVRDAIEKGNNFHIITINPEMIANSSKNDSFLNIIKSSQLNIPDGIGVKLALKLRGINCFHIRGVDFSRKLISYANENNLKIGFIGAKEEVINQACDNFLKQYPSLNIAYKRNGYFNDDIKIIEEIKNAAPRILLVGLGSPRQEEFISKLKNSVNNMVMIGVGGSFDVFSGNVQEAPIIYRKLGLEWLYRTICQPERFRRIFPALPIFLIKCIMENILKRTES